MILTGISISASQLRIEYRAIASLAIKVLRCAWLEANTNAYGKWAVRLPSGSQPVTWVRFGVIFARPLLHVSSVPL
jgi:hypothetical protein